jgi:hypothetical protein
MTLSEAISRINYALRGTDDDAPAASSDEFNYWLSLLNRKKDELYFDVGKQWAYIHKAAAPNEVGTVATAGTTTLTGTNTFFTDYRVGDQVTVSGETVRTIASITSDTSLAVTVAFSNTASGKTFTRTTIIDEDAESYSVHRNFLGASDKVFIQAGDDKHYLDLVHPQEISRASQQVYLSGGNPEALSFTVDIESTDPLVGGSLVIPGYYLPADLTTSTDLLPVPDPNWLVLATASEIAFADIVYEDRAEALNSRANSLWQNMVARNRRGTYGSPRKTPYAVKRITDTRVN